MRLFLLSILVLLAACKPADPVAAPQPGKPASQPSRSTKQPAAKPAAMQDVSASKAAALLESEAGITVLDIRTPGEFASGHIKGAHLIDYKAADFKQKLSALDKSKPYLMHCRSGGRSAAAKPVFAELGFQRVFHLETGILGWQKAELPLEKK